MNTPHTPGPDTKQLTPRIRLEHVQRGKVWRWAVIVDARAEELFVSRDDALTFARGVDIGHSWAPSLLSQRNELRAQRNELAEVLGIAIATIERLKNDHDLKSVDGTLSIARAALDSTKGDA